MPQKSKNTISERVPCLKVTLQERQEEFQQLSKDYFSVHQDCQLKCAQLRDLKSSNARKLKSYVDIVTETALNDADITYKQYVIDEKAELAKRLWDDKYLAIQDLRKSLEEALQMYADSRRNLKEYQSKISSVTDDTRIETLNMVSFCKYAQSVIETGVRTLPRSNYISSKDVVDSRNFYSNCCQKSSQDLSQFYLERISKLRRDEAILTNRLKGPFESDDDDSVQSKHHERHFDNVFETPHSMLVSSAKSRGSHSTNPSSESDTINFLPQLREKVITNESLKEKKGKKKKRQRGQSASSILFDRAKFEAELFAISGVKVDDSISSHLHHHHPAPQNTSPREQRKLSQQPAPHHAHNHHQQQISQHGGPTHNLRENTLLLRDEKTSEQDEKLANLAALACSLEGKQRELSSVKEVSACFNRKLSTIYSYFFN